MSKNLFYEKRGPFPLKEIVKTIGYIGNFSNENNLEIYGFESLNNAGKNDMTFLNSSKYKDLSLKTKAAACITLINLSKFLPKKCVKLDVKNVLFAVTKASKMFYPKADIDYPDMNLKDLSEIRNKHPDINFGKNVLIGKNVKIGKNTIEEWDSQLIEYGTLIIKKRKDCLNSISLLGKNLLESLNKDLSNSSLNYQCSIPYSENNLTDNYQKYLTEYQDKDLILGMRNQA